MSAPAPAKKQRHGPPHTCPHCGKEMRSDNLRAHIRAKHAALIVEQTHHSDASANSTNPADLAGSAIFLHAAASTAQPAQQRAVDLDTSEPARASTGAPATAAASAARSSRRGVHKDSVADSAIRATQLRGSIAWGTPCVFDPLVASTHRTSGICLFAPWMGDDPIAGGKPMEQDGQPCPPLVQLHPFEVTAVSYRSVPLTLVHSDPSSAVYRASPCELYRGEWPDDWQSAIPRALQLSAVSPISCHLPQPVDLSTCAFASLRSDGRLSTYPSTAAAARHPYNLDSIRDHALSLLSLVPDCDMEGFQSAYCHSQTGYDHVKMRHGPLRAPLVHHALRGRTVWFVVPHDQHDRALDALLDILAAHFQLPASVPAAVRRTFLLAFYSQQVFVHPEQLRRRGVTVHAHTLHAGQVLYLRGDCLHWSLNQADQSMAMATHVLPECWLEYGPQGCLDDARFLQSLIDQRARAAAAGSHAPCADLAIESSAHLSALMRLLPQSWVCHLFHAIAADIDKHLQRIHAASSAGPDADAASAQCPAARFAYTLPEATLRRAVQTLRQVRDIMHEAPIVALAAAFGVACLSDPSRCHFRRSE